MIPEKRQYVLRLVKIRLARQQCIERVKVT